MVETIEFQNKTDNPVQVWEYDRSLLILPPNGKMFCEIYDWKTSYARWKKVIFLDNGRMKFEENPDYVWPYPGKLMLTALNVDGATAESFSVAGEYQHCNKGIPKFIPVAINDLVWCFVEKVERRMVESKKREGDYLVPHRELKWIKTERSKREIKKIKEQLLDEATERARQEMEHRFPKSEQSEVNALDGKQ